MNKNTDTYPIARNSFPVLLDFNNQIFFELTTRKFYSIDINDLIHKSKSVNFHSIINYLLIPPNSNIYSLEQLNLEKYNVEISNENFVLNIDEITADIKEFNKQIFEKQSINKENKSLVIGSLIRTDNDKIIKSNAVNAIVLENNLLKGQVKFNYGLATASLLLLISYMAVSSYLPILK